MDFLKKQGESFMNKDKTSADPNAAKSSGIDFSDGVQASDLKAIAGGKDGINLRDGVDMKDAQGFYNAFNKGNSTNPQGAAPIGNTPPGGAVPGANEPPLAPGAPPAQY